MIRVSQDPADPAFVQDPYPFYDRLRAAGPLAWWDEYAMPMAASHTVVSALLRDRRFGRADPAPPSRPVHQAAFWAVEDRSMLEIDGPDHARLRGQVLRAFTSRRVGGMAGEVRALAHELIDGFPSGPFDLLDAFARPFPVRVIARLLGVPEADAPRLLAWSNAMVRMYQARRTRADEDGAAKAARDFTDYLNGVLSDMPGDGLAAHLLTVEREGRLSRAEVVSTCILLLNAGHEATVHTLGNGVRLLIGHRAWGDPVTEDAVEEAMRLDPPLHLFTRYAQDEVEAFGHAFARGDRVGLLLGAANRDPAAYGEPRRYRPGRVGPGHMAFGGGAHFCLGAPLARLELLEGLRALAGRLPRLRIAAEPRYAAAYHFHGLERLMVEAD